MTVIKCCMNCEYYFAFTEPEIDSKCIIDNKKVNPHISHIVKCKAFKEWWGAVD